MKAKALNILFLSILRLLAPQGVFAAEEDGISSCERQVRTPAAFGEKSDSSDLARAMELVVSMKLDEFHQLWGQLQLSPEDWLTVMTLTWRTNQRFLVDHIDELPLSDVGKIQLVLNSWLPDKNVSIPTYAASKIDHIKDGNVLFHILTNIDTDTIPVDLKIAIVAFAANTSKIAELLILLGLDDRQRVQAMKVLLEVENISKSPFFGTFTNYSAIDEFFNLYKIDDPALRFEFLEAMVAVFPVQVANSFRNNQKNYRELLEPVATERKFTFLKEVARQDITFNGQDGRAYGFKLMASFDFPHPMYLTLVETILGRLAAYDWTYPQDMSKGEKAALRSLSHAEKEAVLTNLLRNTQPCDFSDAAVKANFDNFIVQWMGNVFAVATLGDQAASQIFRQCPYEVLLDFHGTSDSRYRRLLLSDEEADLDLDRFLRDFARRFPAVLSEESIELFWDRSRDSEIVRQLITYYFKYLPRRNEAFVTQANWQPVDSLELVAAITGIKYEDVKDTDISKRPRTFYGLLLDIQSAFSTPVFADIPFDAEVYRDGTTLVAFLTAMRDNLFILGRNEQGLKRLKGVLRSAGTLNMSTMEDLIPVMKDEVVKHLKSLVEGASQSQTETTFTYEDLEALFKTWGDIEPILTLLARFSGQTKWKPEVATMMTVFSQVIKSKFEAYKFESEEAAAQLEGLTKSQIAAWRQDRHMLTLSSSGAAQSSDPSQAFASIIDIFSTNLAPHYSDVQATFKELPNLERSSGFGRSTPAKATSRTVSQNFDDLAASLERGAPPKLVGEWLKENALALVDQASAQEDLQVALAQQLIRHGFSQLEKIMSNPSTLEEERQKAFLIIRVMWGSLIARKGLSTEQGMVKQVIEDLKSMESAIRATQVQDLEMEQSGLVLTVVNSAPRLLMTVGDLVNTSSCQNYRTGGMIHTLLGYVIDANVRAMASFHLKPEDFVTQDDYNFIREALVHGKSVTIDFDGDKKVASFSVRGYQAIQSRPLGQAYLRQMVKIGMVENGKSSAQPGVVLERAYSQNHPSMNVMLANHRALYEALREDVGGAAEGHVKMIKTRNPLGVYSDLAGGVKTDDYSIALSQGRPK